MAKTARPMPLSHFMSAQQSYRAAALETLNSECVRFAFFSLSLP
jgi:hypothetical protein